MKKIIPIIVGIVLLATTNGFSQDKNMLAFNFTKPVKVSTDVTKINSAYINVKAKGDFVKFFRNITNETWFSVRGGYIANFLSNGVDYRIIYDQKGNRQHTQLTYDEYRLPFKIRDLVKSRYYDFDIIYCTEYPTYNNSVYVIKMKGAKTIGPLYLKITDDEIEEIRADKRS